MKRKETIDFTPYNNGTAISPQERAILRNLIYQMRELESDSKWAYYNARWWIREHQQGRKSA